MKPTPPLTRREFLRRAGGLGFLAFSSVSPAFLVRSALTDTPAPERDRTILVIIQLAGGNDGLNTVVPFTDDNYHRLRPGLALNRGLHQINGDLALHPACSGLHRLLGEGKLGIIQNVGYPNPNRSHFRSTEIWETAGDGDRTRRTGWLGRYFDNACSGAPGNADPGGIHIGNQLPNSFLSEDPQSIFGVPARSGFTSGNDAVNHAYKRFLETDHAGENAEYLRHTMLNTMVTEERVAKHIGDYRTSAGYPRSRLGQSMRRIAALIHAEMETRVYFVSQSGYDTHANQLNNHERLLSDLSNSMSAFQKDLEGHGKDNQVLTMTFSEFGRRPAENASSGTDHGTAAPLFMMGPRVRAPLLGDSPGLGIGPGQDLSHTIDFRQVYATVLQNWLDCPAEPILGGGFDPLAFI